MMGKGLRQALLLLAVSLVAAVGTHFFHPLAPMWYLQQEPLAEDEVDLGRIDGEWSGEVVWLDARPGDQYDVGHIPGAKRLNEQGFDEQLFELLDVLQTTDLPIVIYCGAESCQASRKVKQRLVETFPLENVWVLKGGWKAWKEAGREVE